MPRPPFPNAIRAAIGFPIGMILMILAVAVTRFIFGGTIYVTNFWEDEATLMFALLGGAFGFLWGAGAVFDFEAHDEHKSLVPVSHRIPLNPDDPTPSGNPVMAMLEAIPAVIYAVIILVLTVGWLFIVVSLGRLPVGPTIFAIFFVGLTVRFISGNRAAPATNTLIIVGLLVAFGVGIDLGILPSFLPSEPLVQTTNEDAELNDFGTASYSILGLVELDETNQAALFGIFALVVILGIVIGATGVGLLVFLLNQSVNTVQGEDPAPFNSDFFPNRLAAFFTEWALDIVNGLGSGFRR